MNEIMIVKNVRCYVDKGNVAQLNLEDVARGLGFTTVATSGNEVVRWNTVHKYLCDLGVATSCNGSDYRSMCPDFVPENIFYRLAMKAKNEVAERFQAIIADEVLPSIRKYGVYATAETAERLMSDPDFLIQTFTALKEERAKRAALETKAREDKPKVLFADAVSTAHTSILVGELAKVLKQNGVEIGQNRLFSQLRNEGYLIRRNGSDYNMPTQRSMELELFEIKETTIANPDGSIRINKTPKVTGKGQQYFISKFLY